MSLNTSRIDFFPVDPQKKVGILLNLLDYLQPALVGLSSLLQLVAHIVFGSRLLTCITYIVLFPLFLVAALVSTILNFLLNHMTRPREFTPSHQHHPTPYRATDADLQRHEQEGKQQMDYWLERCSICFDARLELCLDHCRDQYCLDCFRRYITEVVMSSWGLTVTKIRCPVCQTQIPQSEWSQFVPAHVVEHYNRFNRPYRPYSRCCPQCETEAFPCEYKDKNAVFSEQQQQTQTQTQAQAQKQNQTQVQVHTMIQDLLDTLPFYCQGPEMDQLLQIYDHQTWHNATLPEIYRRTMLLLFRTVVDSTAYHSNLLAISHRILLLDMKPDTWKQLQFAHISFFPVHECRACNTPFCLQCGQNAHPKMTCEAAMRHILESEAPSESSETVKWTLEHSRQCPSCSILIHRDEGCNKVDCSLCGFCFCWVCRLPWSERCGFYQCALTGPEEDVLFPDTVDIKTERGVPNVSVIQARLSSSNL